MRSFHITSAVLVILAGFSTAQHGVDPAYLQQYYQQVASQAGHRAAAGASHHQHQHQQDATPIFESNGEQPQQYINQGQQIRLKDNAQDQVRAQQQNSQHTQAYVAPNVREYLQQPQPQQVQYVSSQPQQVGYKQNAARQQLLRRPQEEYQSHGGKLEKEGDDYDPNPSYQFGFDVKDDEFTNYQNRKEVRDGNVIKGSYSVVDSDGFIRTVKYTADPKEGFKAEVIREPTDIVVKIPTPAPAQLLRHQEPSPQHQQYLSPHQVKAQQQYYQQ